MHACVTALFRHRLHGPPASGANMATCEALCYINGKRYVLPEGRAEVTLLTYLRGEDTWTQDSLANLDSMQDARRSCSAPFTRCSCYCCCYRRCL